MYDDLKGKVALVTGATRKRGIGRAIALRLAKEGADVAVHGRYRPLEDFPEWEKQEGWRGLDSLVKEIESLGRHAFAITADVSNSKEVSEIVPKALERFGHLDILVNNAVATARKPGRDQGVPVIEMEEEFWNNSLAVNLTAPFLLCRAMAKEMIARGRGGNIINILSTRSKVARAGGAAYCASKAGLQSLTQVLALELGPYGFRVNAVCPGTILSWSSRAEKLQQALHRGLTEEKAISDVYADRPSPLNRLGTPDDVANVVTFLCSDQSSYMTGQAINVTGGRVMGL